MTCITVKNIFVLRPTVNLWREQIESVEWHLGKFPLIYPIRKSTDFNVWLTLSLDLRSFQFSSWQAVLFLLQQNASKDNFDFISSFFLYLCNEMRTNEPWSKDRKSKALGSSVRFISSHRIINCEGTLVRTSYLWQRYSTSRKLEAGQQYVLLPNSSYTFMWKAPMLCYIISLSLPCNLYNTKCYHWWCWMSPWWTIDSKISY